MKEEIEEAKPKDNSVLGNIKIDIDPKQVNEAISKAIIESSLGVQVKERLEKKYKELHDAYKLSSDIDREIERAIELYIRDVIEREYKPVIEAKIRSKITDEVLTQFVDRVFKTYRDRW